MLSVYDCKYDIGDRVLAKVNYSNDSRDKIEGIICGVQVEIDDCTKKENIIYKLKLKSEKNDGYVTRYVSEDRIMELKEKCNKTNMVNMDDLIIDFENLAKKDQLLIGGNTKQNDLLTQIIGTIVRRRFCKGNGKWGY